MPASSCRCWPRSPSDAFDDPDWLFEVKWDGYRVEALVSAGRSGFTRNGRDAEAYFPGFLTPPTWIDAREAVVDGEVVALDEEGRPDFGLLQARISDGRQLPAIAGPPCYQAFDLLHLDGRSLLAVPLEDRKRLLRSVLRPKGRVSSRRTSSARGGVLPGGRPGDWRASSPSGARVYEPGRRAHAWLKVKVRPEQELVVGGYLPGEGTRTELGALVVGVYDDGRLRYAGRVGSGSSIRGRARRCAAASTACAETPPL